MMTGACGVGACSDESGEPTELGLAQGTHALSQCAGTLFEQTLALPYSERVATIRTCMKRPPAQPEVEWVVASKVVDPIDEWRRNYEAFVTKHHKLDPAVALHTSGDIDVDVWFAVDERDLPSKVQQLNDAQTRMAAQSTLGARVSSAASSLKSAIAVRIPGASFAPALIQPVPRLTMRLAASALPVLSEVAEVVRVMPAADYEKEVLQSENYIQLGLFDTSAAFGWTGSGVTVGMLEGAQPNSYANLNGVPTGGSCSGNFLCACPSGSTDWHMRATMGIVRNSVTAWGGAASAVTTLPANWASGSGCSLSGSAQWALNNGASILNRSACGSPGSPQTGTDMYLDYLATQNPYPTITGVTGNQAPGTTRSCMNLHNGLVVGAANDNGSAVRANATMSPASQTANWQGASGWELPHVVAPGTQIDSAGVLAGQIELIGNGNGSSSYAAPQVAGVAAAAQQVNVAIRSWPEAFIPAVLVGADQNVDQAMGGVFPLDLADNVDDRDGAGLLNGWITTAVLLPANQRNGGGTPSTVGHDYGLLTLNANAWYPEFYNARVPPGQWLRVASHAMAKVTCGTPASQSNCTGTQLPLVGLFVGSNNYYPAMTKYVANPNQTYQYAAVQNTKSTTEDFTIAIYQYQSPIPYTTYGLAWVAQ
ncbi:MAG: hypothetical protein R3B13_11300 [Polyangiaceae bacterium]